MDRCADEDMHKEAPKMVYRRELFPPPGPERHELQGSGRNGMWWERSDGLEVRVAACERECKVDRSRLSLLGMLVACLASSNRPKP